MSRSGRTYLVRRSVPDVALNENEVKGRVVTVARPVRDGDDLENSVSLLDPLSGDPDSDGGLPGKSLLEDEEAEGMPSSPFARKSSGGGWDSAEGGDEERKEGGAVSLEVEAERVRALERREKRKVAARLLPHERLALDREERTRARWEDMQREWARFRRRAAKKQGREEGATVSARADEYREVAEEYEIVSRAAPKEPVGDASAWESTLRGGGDRYIRVGNAFSGLYAPVREGGPPKQVIRRPRAPDGQAVHAATVGSFKTHTTTSTEAVGQSAYGKNWRDAPALRRKRRQVEGEIKKIRPYEPTGDAVGSLCVVGEDLLAWARAGRGAELGPHPSEELGPPLRSALRVSPRSADSGSRELGPHHRLSPGFEYSGEDEDGEQEEEEEDGVLLTGPHLRVGNSGASSAASGGGLQAARNSVRVTVAASVREQTSDSVVLRNVGTTALRFTVERADDDAESALVSKDGRLPAAAEPRFLWTNPRGTVLPGQSLSIHLLFQSSTPGVFRENHQIRTIPPANGGVPIRLSLRGTAAAADKSSVAVDRVTSRVDRVASRRAVEEIVRDVIDLAATAVAERHLPEPIETELDRERFERANPGLVYRTKPFWNLLDVAADIIRVRDGVWGSSVGEDAVEKAPENISSGKDAVEKAPENMSSGKDAVEKSPENISSGKGADVPPPENISSGEGADVPPSENMLDRSNARLRRARSEWSDYRVETLATWLTEAALPLGSDWAEERAAYLSRCAAAEKSLRAEEEAAKKRAEEEAAEGGGKSAGSKDKKAKSSKGKGKKEEEVVEAEEEKDPAVLEHERQVKEWRRLVAGRQAVEALGLPRVVQAVQERDRLFARLDSAVWALSLKAPETSSIYDTVRRAWVDFADAVPYAAAASKFRFGCPSSDRDAEPSRAPVPTDSEILAVRREAMPSNPNTPRTSPTPEEDDAEHNEIGTAHNSEEAEAEAEDEKQQDHEEELETSSPENVPPPPPSAAERRRAKLAGLGLDVSLERPSALLGASEERGGLASPRASSKPPQRPSSPASPSQARAMIRGAAARGLVAVLGEDGVAEWVRARGALLRRTRRRARAATLGRIPALEGPDVGWETEAVEQLWGEEDAFEEAREAHREFLEELDEAEDEDIGGSTVVHNWIQNVASSLQRDDSYRTKQEEELAQERQARQAALEEKRKAEEEAAAAAAAAAGKKGGAKAKKGKEKDKPAETTEPETDQNQPPSDSTFAPSSERRLPLIPSEFSDAAAPQNLSEPTPQNTSEPTPQNLSEPAPQNPSSDESSTKEESERSKLARARFEAGVRQLVLDVVDACAAAGARRRELRVSAVRDKSRRLVEAEAGVVTAPSVESTDLEDRTVLYRGDLDLPFADLSDAGFVPDEDEALARLIPTAEDVESETLPSEVVEAEERRMQAQARGSSMRSSLRSQARGRSTGGSRGGGGAGASGTGGGGGSSLRSSKSGRSGTDAMSFGAAIAMDEDPAVLARHPQVMASAAGVEAALKAGAKCVVVLVEQGAVASAGERAKFGPWTPRHAGEWAEHVRVRRAILAELEEETRRVSADEEAIAKAKAAAAKGGRLRLSERAELATLASRAVVSRGRLRAEQARLYAARLRDLALPQSLVPAPLPPSITPPSLFRSALGSPAASPPVSSRLTAEALAKALSRSFATDQSPESSSLVFLAPSPEESLPAFWERAKSVVSSASRGGVVVVENLRLLRSRPGLGCLSRSALPPTIPELRSAMLPVCVPFTFPSRPVEWSPLHVSAWIRSVARAHPLAVGSAARHRLDSLASAAIRTGLDGSAVLALVDAHGYPLPSPWATIGLSAADAHVLAIAAVEAVSARSFPLHSKSAPHPASKHAVNQLPSNLTSAAAAAGSSSIASFSRPASTASSTASRPPSATERHGGGTDLFESAALAASVGALGDALVWDSSADFASSGELCAAVGSSKYSSSASAAPPPRCLGPQAWRCADLLGRWLDGPGQPRARAWTGADTFGWRRQAAEAAKMARSLRSAATQPTTSSAGAGSSTDIPVDAAQIKRPVVTIVGGGPLHLLSAARTILAAVYHTDSIVIGGAIGVVWAALVQGTDMEASLRALASLDDEVAEENASSEEDSIDVGSLGDRLWGVAWTLRAAAAVAVHRGVRVIAPRDFVTGTRVPRAVLPEFDPEDVDADELEAEDEAQDEAEEEEEEEAAEAEEEADEDEDDEGGWIREAKWTVRRMAVVNRKRRFRDAAQALLDVHRSWLSSAQDHPARSIPPSDALTPAHGIDLTGHILLDYSGEVTEESTTSPVTQIAMDIGSATRELATEAIATAGTIIWSGGAMGVVECDEFAEGTREVASALHGAIKRGSDVLVSGNAASTFFLQATPSSSRSDIFNQAIIIRSSEPVRRILQAQPCPALRAILP